LRHLLDVSVALLDCTVNGRLTAMGESDYGPRGLLSYHLLWLARLQPLMLRSAFALSVIIHNSRSHRQEVQVRESFGDVVLILGRNLFERVVDGIRQTPRRIIIAEEHVRQRRFPKRYDTRQYTEYRLSKRLLSGTNVTSSF
jgi:hypothetical protein